MLIMNTELIFNSFDTLVETAIVLAEALRLKAPLWFPVEAKHHNIWIFIDQILNLDA